MPLVVAERTVSEYASSFEKIEALQEEARRLLARIQDVYAEIGQVAGTGRMPRGKATVASNRQAGKATRAPRGALKAAIRKVLAGGKAVRPAEIVKRLPEAGYKTASSPRTFYTSVYLALKRDKAIKKTGEGFKLKK